MKTKRVYLLILGGFVLFLVGLAGCAQPIIPSEPIQYSCVEGVPKTNQNPDAPVIVHACAVDRGYYGKVLRIYLEATDPNEDMVKIATTVDQVGYGRYPTDFIILKPEYRKNFKGYIQWNTFSSNASYLPEWNYVTLRVSVFDKKGRESNEFEFRYTFETGTGPQPSPPAPFDQTDLPKLGNVDINLYNPYLMGGGDSDRD